MSKNKSSSSVVLGAGLLLSAACGPKAPPEDPEPQVVCDPMPPEAYEYVRTAPRITPEAFAKLDMDAGIIVEVINQRVFGTEGKPRIDDRFLPHGCVPRRLGLGITLRGKVAESLGALEAVGFTIGGRIEAIDGSESFLGGSISPSRLVDLALIPAVTEVEVPRSMIPELNKSAGYTGVTALRSQQSSATGAGVVVAILDTGIDWKHGAFRRPDGRTRIAGIWGRTLEPVAGEVAGPDGRGVVYRETDIDHSLGYAVPASENPVRVRRRDRAAERAGGV